ncbi:MAG TPA: hypothetical protein VMY37_31865 [Thermoguttaceae bacterium]|nr:hypothetical protein [Thermoguttaceae bacterium]
MENGRSVYAAREERVVGVRNLRDGGAWLRTINATAERPTERLAGAKAAREEGARNWAIVTEIEWRHLRDHDMGVSNGWLVRDDSVVPETMVLAPSDQAGGADKNPNAILDSELDAVLDIKDTGFNKRLKVIGSPVALDRLMFRAETRKKAGELEMYPKIDAISSRSMLLRAMEDGMPMDMADPDVTMGTMTRLAEEKNIVLSREAQRDRSAMIREICSHFLVDE